MEDAFFWFAYHFGDIGKVYQFHFAAFDVPTLDAIIALIVQMVYCWRIWVLSKWRVMPVLTALVRVILCLSARASSTEGYCQLALLAASCGIASGIRVSAGNIERPLLFLNSCARSFNFEVSSSLMRVIVFQLWYVNKPYHCFDSPQKSDHPPQIWLFGSAITDIIIASSMCYIVSLVPLSYLLKSHSMH